MVGMILSDSDIQSAIERNEIRFDPCIDPDLQLQPVSIDLRLARWFRTFNTNQCFLIDPLATSDLEQVTTLVEVKADVTHPYVSQGRAKYQGQRTPTASCLGQDQEFRRKA
jgi:dCTP deaminase